MPRRSARQAVLALSTVALAAALIGGAGTASAAESGVSTVAMITKSWRIVDLGLPDLDVSHGRKVK